MPYLGAGPRPSAHSVDSRAERAPLPDDAAAGSPVAWVATMPATQSATRRNAAPTRDSYREAYIDVAPGVVLNGRLTLPATTSARGAVAFPTVSRGPLHNPYNRLAVSTLARAGFAALVFDCLTAGEKGSVVPPINPATGARSCSRTKSRLVRANALMRRPPCHRAARIHGRGARARRAGARR